MQRLRGLAASFLQVELGPHPMGNLRVVILRPPDGRRVTLVDVRTRIEERLDRLPSLRWRIVPVPFGLQHPVAVDDPDLDLEAHLEHIVLADGDDEAFDRLLADRAARHLARDRPLWNLALVDGLADGRQAVVLQVHHAITDGTAGRNMLVALFGSPRAEALPPVSGGVLDRRTLVRRALVDDWRAVRSFPGFVARSVRGQRAVRRHARTATVTPPVPGPATPRTELHRSFTAERRVARASLPLADIDRLRASAGATINDIALAVVGGAVRSYLAERSTLPAASVLASIPVGTDSGSTTCRTWGVHVDVLYTTLATDEGDPWRRLQRVHEATAEAKRRFEVRGRHLVEDAAEFFPPGPTRLAVRLAHRARLAADRRGSTTTRDTALVVSNVRGPVAQWELDGVPVEEVYLSGPPMPPTPVNVTLISYGGRLWFTVCASADALPDAGALARRFTAAFDELAAAAPSTGERLPVPVH